MGARWSGALQIAAVYVGTIVGAGFATGREIAEFFTRYGLSGFMGIFIAGGLFIYIGTKMMILSARSGVNNYEEFNRMLFGGRIAPLINLFFLIMLMGVTAVMISGAGAVFEEQLGVSRFAGTGITICLASFVLWFGMKGLFTVNSFVVPVMIFFSLLLCSKAWGSGMSLDGVFHIQEVGISFHALLSPFAYAAFNLALAQAVLVPIASEVKDERLIWSGAVLGGVFLTIILLAGHLSLTTLPNVMDYEIPAAELMKRLLPGMHWFYLLVIYGEIFTSVIGNVFGLQRQLSSYINLPKVLIVLIICGCSIMISRFEYGRLLGWFYPMFGYISLLFLVLVWRKGHKKA